MISFASNLYQNHASMFVGGTGMFGEGAYLVVIENCFRLFGMILIANVKDHVGLLSKQR